MRENNLPAEPNRIDLRISELSESYQKEFHSRLAHLLTSHHALGQYGVRYYSKYVVQEAKMALFLRDFAHLPKPGGLDGEEGKEAHEQMFKRLRDDRTS